MSTEIDDELNELSAQYPEARAFKGKELYPFTRGRRDAAQALGVKLLSGVAMPADGTLYAGATADAIAILWVCTQDYLTLRGIFRGPDPYWEKIMKWSDANIASDAEQQEAVRLSSEIIRETFASHAVAVPLPSSGPQSPIEDRQKN